MDHFSARDYQEMLSLLQEERELVEQMLARTKEQPAFIAAEDTDAFAGSLAARGELMAQFDAVHGRLTPLAERSATALEALAPSHPQRAAVEQLRAAIRDALEQMQALDRETHTKAKGAMAQFSAELKRLGQSRKGIGLYTQSGQSLSGSAYFDKTQ